MKHPSSRAFYAYWDSQRGDERAPCRSVIEPGALRELLGDIFMVSYNPSEGHLVRVAGTRVNALLGGETKGVRFADLFVKQSRADLAEIIRAVGDDMLVAVAGVSGQKADGTLAHLELLLMPLRARAHAPRAITGLLVPLFPGRLAALSRLDLMSWRYVTRSSQSAQSRTLRTLALARGLVVYEGLR